MAAILSAEHLSKSYTLKKLLTDVTIYVGEHDRIGVVGVNGTGKSTLLKLLSGLDEPDGGVVMRKNGLRVSYLPQMPDYSQPRTAVQQVLFDAPKDVGAPDEYEAKALLSQFGIDDFDADVRTLSGGQKKRVALAAALIRPVDLLMLDEPTNHIDAETIALLEGRLAKYRGALIRTTDTSSTACATALRKSATANCICTTETFRIILNRRPRGWRWRTRRRESEAPSCAASWSGFGGARRPEAPSRRRASSGLRR